MMRPILFCQLCLGDEFSFDGGEYRKTNWTEATDSAGTAWHFDSGEVVSVSRRSRR